MRSAAWVNRALGCAFLILVAACSTPKSEGSDKDKGSVVACKEVARFGNGALCDSKDPQLSICGTHPHRSCVSSWLCFDGPALAFCTCEQDEDCQGRADYINEGRLLRQIAPLGARCQAGRCQGAP